MRSGSTRAPAGGDPGAKYWDVIYSAVTKWTEGMMARLVTAIAAAALSILMVACAEAPTAAPQSSVVAGQSILARSNPTNGSSVAGPVNQIELWFKPPARLGEVTVTGPEGTMPMMVTAVGEVGYYSIPVPGLENGSYTVNWKAMAAGTEYKGDLSFTVR